MKKSISVAVACAIALGMALCFAGCGEDDSHTHKFTSTWSYDSESHWHEATCPDGVEMGLIDDKAPHGTPDADGKCPTCEYQLLGMSLADFKTTENYGEKIRDYARQFAAGTDMTTVEREFVWVKTDSNNWITSLNYLYIAPKSASAAASAKSQMRLIPQSHMKVSANSSTRPQLK